MTLTLTRDVADLPPVGRRDVAAHVRCDYCQEPLYPEAGGAVAWEPDPREVYLDVAFLHRSCVDGYADRRDVDLDRMELEPFLRSLVHNLEVAG